MGPVTVDAEAVLFFSVPHSCSLAMETGLPFTQYYAVTLTAEVVRFLEPNDRPIGESQRIPVIGIMAVKAPSAGHMVEDDILMHPLELSRLSVYRHTLMTL